MEGGSSNSIVTMLTTQATTLASNLTSLINDMGPIIVGVIVTVALLTAGIALFKKLTGKAK